MTTIGDLNRRLVIEAPVETDDGTGGVTRSFAVAATVWGNIAPVTVTSDWLWHLCRRPRLLGRVEPRHLLEP
jgi:hypothetical protein